MAHENIKWTETLPAVLLGLRVAVKPDINASSAELVDLPDTIPDPIISAESSHRHPVTTNMQTTKSGRRFIDFEEDLRPLCPCGNNDSSINTRVTGGHNAGEGRFPGDIRLWSGVVLDQSANLVGSEIQKIRVKEAVKITPSCCLSEKWRIINLLDDIWMLLPEVESLGSWRKAAVGQVWLQSSELLTASFHDFGDNFKLQEQLSGGFSSGRPRGTTPADDRYIVLQARRNRWQTAEKSLDTRHRRLDDRYRVLPWPEDCTVVVCLHDALYGVPLTPAHRRRRSLWCREHRN
ncbi:hypothetical protein TNCV_4865091 [Trichonephila clavipes]|nr:hypothetical protein TNCV_4865091 [Trichonephila clavipes]